MVSCSSNVTGKRSPLVFFGLSTDNKPTGKYNEVEITNGSLFLYIDTDGYAQYDVETKSWIERG